MKVSLICTLKNEESNVANFLETLMDQSRPPDEIIIVDGGSTDGTVDIIQSYIEKGFPIKLLQEPGVNIARGRNIAIQHAQHPVIASTDAGCRVDKNWLNEIVKPFEASEKVDVVAGWFEADPQTLFERMVAVASYARLDEIDPDEFLPSSRSIAFTKAAWEKVNGYPEWLTLTAEDTLFDLNLKKAGCTFVFAPEAVIYWRPRETLKKLMKQYYMYARGDREAGIYGYKYVKKMVKYGLGLVLLFLGCRHRFFWGLLVVLLGYYYCSRSVKRRCNVFWLIFIETVTEVSQIIGWLSGERLHSSE